MTTRKQLPLDTTKSADADALKSWALVELFGHQRVVGWVTVDPPDFPGMIRVDVPDLVKDCKVAEFGRGGEWG